MLQKVPIYPGTYVDETPLTAEGFFTRTDKIRYNRGVPEVMGGWELLSTTALTGKCRAILPWADNNLVKYIGVGSHTNLYAVTDSLPYDITPISSRQNQVSISFTTVISTAVVTADWTSHGLIQGQAFRLANATVTTVGGVTINTAAATTTIPSPQYIVLTVNTANQITFTAAQVATSSAGPTASTVDASIYLAPGLADAISALGYGTGVYSTASTYSSPGSGAVYLRTWALAAYGQNLLANPRGGALYEWAPAVTNTELVTNGTFTGSAAGWALGANWAYGGNAVAATNSSASLTQTITTPTNAFCSITFDISGFSAGTLGVSFNSNSIVTGIAANGRYTYTFFSVGAAATLSFTGVGFTGTLDTVTSKQLLTAEIVPNAPTQNTFMLVTPEGFVMVFGTTPVGSSIFDPMMIRWSDIGTKSLAEQTWTPASTNLSSFVRPLVGSRIVGARVGNNEILVWTDKALYALTYANNSNLVYSLRLVGTNCGLIGPNAATVLGGVAYWMTPTGNTMAYSGGVPQLIKSTMSRDVFDHISLIQQDKIYAGTISKFFDAMWLYPDSRDGNECSRYALLDTQEQAPTIPGQTPGGVGVFANGTFDRLCWAEGGTISYPVAVDASGYIYYQEKGNTANGGPMSWLLQTGAIQIGNGVTQFMVDTFIPDFKSLSGGCSLTAYAYLYPQSDPVTHGPFSIVAMSEQISMLSDAPVGREISMLFQGSASPAFMRSGHHMFDIQDTGMPF